MVRVMNMIDLFTIWVFSMFLSYIVYAGLYYAVRLSAWAIPFLAISLFIVIALIRVIII